MSDEFGIEWGDLIDEIEAQRLSGGVLRDDLYADDDDVVGPRMYPVFVFSGVVMKEGVTAFSIALLDTNYVFDGDATSLDSLFPHVLAKSELPILVDNGRLSMYGAKTISGVWGPVGSAALILHGTQQGTKGDGYPVLWFGTLKFTGETLFGQDVTIPGISFQFE